MKLFIVDNGKWPRVAFRFPSIDVNASAMMLHRRVMLQNEKVHVTV